MTDNKGACWELILHCARSPAPVRFSGGHHKNTVTSSLLLDVQWGLCEGRILHACIVSCSSLTGFIHPTDWLRQTDRRTDISLYPHTQYAPSIIISSKQQQ